MPDSLETLKREMNLHLNHLIWTADLYAAQGYRAHLDAPNAIARAEAFAALMRFSPKHIYHNDLIAGSLRGLMAAPDEADDMSLAAARRITASYGERNFVSNRDHFAPDYETLLRDGVDGVLRRIEASLEKYKSDEDKARFLTAARIAMRGFSDYIALWADAAEGKGLSVVAAACRRVSHLPPASFREALQLVWLSHLAFCCEGRYAMALGRMDQYLYPFYRRDRETGVLTDGAARELIACALVKIGEKRLMGGDDVVNIAVGGLTPAGEDATNALSTLIVQAVGDCFIPGPNLSARLHAKTTDAFLDECLKVIGTGLGYPALMNDEVNVPALARHGYALEDARDYCMVGCIENFLPGRQPPWSDGRFNTPKYVELALNDGVDMLTGVQAGPKTGDAGSFETMDAFMEALMAQLRFGAAEYMALFRNENERLNRAAYVSPFLSCFARDCIARGRDINDGGCVYPSVHGAACMGIGTVADSLAAIEDMVFDRGEISLSALRDALRRDFAGDEALRRRLLNAPKYGNDDERADKWAVWFVKTIDDLFSRYRTYDGGAIYTAIAANTQNVSAGREVAATPDGRRARAPLSDAASPTYGRDRSGPTAALLSVSKPDYTRVSCGTVLNQKYSPALFASNEGRARLRSMIRVYFARGGQEIQINAVSRDTLKDAMLRPEDYESLVVRVSGFSAYFTSLDRAVQEDILMRTEHA